MKEGGKVRGRGLGSNEGPNKGIRKERIRKGNMERLEEEDKEGGQVKMPE
jgi:hypothetical protein